MAINFNKVKKEDSQSELSKRIGGGKIDTPKKINVIYHDGGLYDIAINKISPDPNQPRKIFDEEELSELAQSIKKHGLIQPVVVRKDSKNSFIIIAGERRYRALQEIGAQELKCFLKETDRPDELALIENVQRQDLKPLEEAEAFKNLQEKYNYSQEELANVVGKARTTVTQILSLNKLPDEIKKECVRAHISKRALVAVARQRSKKEQMQLFKKVKSGEFTSDDARKKVRKPRASNAPKSKIAYEKAQDFSSFLSKTIKNKTKVEIDYSSKEGLKFIAILDDIRDLLKIAPSNKYNTNNES